MQFNAKVASIQFGAKPLDEPAPIGLSNVDYYNNGWWVGLSGGNSVAFLGTIVQSAMSSYSHHLGTQSNQRSAPPVIENFEPVDPAINETAEEFGSRYNQTGSLQKSTRPSFELGAEATMDKFYKQIFKPIPAIGFIGHSYSPLNRAVGFCFGQIGSIDDENLYQCFERIPTIGEPEYPGFIGQTVEFNGAWYEIDAGAPFVSQAKIVFFAACDLDSSMQQFVGITNSTAGRALVVPTSPTDITLDMGEFEWLQILNYLTSGQNLQQAVAHANQDVINKAPWHDTNGNVFPPQTWQVIGDSGNGGVGVHF